MFLSIQENIPEKMTKSQYFFSLSYNIDMYHDINFPLIGKEMLTETVTHTYVATLLLAPISWHIIIF